MTFFLKSIPFLVCLGLTMLVSPVHAEPREVNVYSARQEHLIRPLLDAFTAETGISVNLLTAKADQLLARLKNEGSNTPADVLLTSDVGRLHRAKISGVLSPVQSKVLEENIPANFRDPEGTWFGLSLRSRVIFYAKDRVNPDDIKRYEDLAQDRWRGRICIRSSGNIYNQSLLASLISHLGREKAKAWAQGVVNNMARRPQGGDRDQIRAVAAGQCDIAVANTYYYAGLITSKNRRDREAAEAVGLIWPNQEDRGAHINISGAGVTKYAHNRDAAIALIEFLSGKEAQGLYAARNYEHPLRQDIKPSELLTSWGTFKMDSLPLWKLGEHNRDAVRMFDQVGWR